RHAGRVLVCEPERTEDEQRIHQPEHAEREDDQPGDDRPDSGVHWRRSIATVLHARKDVPSTARRTRARGAKSAHVPATNAEAECEEGAADEGEGGAPAGGAGPFPGAGELAAERARPA